MTRWTEVSWKRVGKALLVVFATPILFLGMRHIVNRQLAPWRYARMLSAMYPYIDLLPESPPDSRLATLEGERVERFGFAFQLPWKHTARQLTYETFAILSSDDRSITVQNPSSSFDLFPTELHALGVEPRAKCAFIGAAMAARPDQVKWWQSLSRNAKSSYPLMMKSMIQVGAPGRPYTIRQGDICGIQQGSPSPAPSEVKLDLFDSAGRHYEITINQFKSGPPLTQAEVNAIIASLRPIPHR